MTELALPLESLPLGMTAIPPVVPKPASGADLANVPSKQPAKTTAFPLTVLPAPLRLLRPKKECWPEPEGSIGEWRAASRNIQCWDIKGPALERWKELEEVIDQCFRGESMRHNVLLTCYMCGKAKDKALPTIFVWGGDTQSRERAEVLIKHECLPEVSGCRAFHVVSVARAPGYRDLIPLARYTALPSSWSQLCDDVTTLAHELDRGFGRSGITARASGGSENDFLRPSAWNCWTRISTEAIGIWQHKTSRNFVLSKKTSDGMRIGSASGPITIEHFGTFLMTTAHTLTPQSPFNHLVSPNYDEGADDDALEDILDAECSDDYSCIATANYVAELLHLDAHVRDGEHNHVERCSTPSITDNIMQQSSETAVELPTTEIDMKLYDAVRMDTTALNGIVDSSALDYAILSVPTALLNHQSAVDFSKYSFFDPSLTAMTDVPRTLSVMTPEGILEGHLLASPTLMKSANDSQRTTALWTLVFDASVGNSIGPGVSGAWVFDMAQQQLYGHIVAGNPKTGLAFVVPFHFIYDALVKKCAVAQASLEWPADHQPPPHLLISLANRMFPPFWPTPSKHVSAQEVISATPPTQRPLTGLNLALLGAALLGPRALTTEAPVVDGEQLIFESLFWSRSTVPALTSLTGDSLWPHPELGDNIKESTDKMSIYSGRSRRSNRSVRSDLSLCSNHSMRSALSFHSNHSVRNRISVS